MNIRKIRRVIRNILLGVAYFTVILQWLWVAILVVPPLIESGAFDALSQERPTPSQNTPVNAVEITGPMLWVIGGITVAMLLLTAVILIKIPKTVLRTSETIVHRTSDAVIPIVTNHAVLPAKKRRELSRRLTLMVQLFASILPAIICLFLQPVKELTQEIIITMALCMVIISVVGFVLAWLVEPQPRTTLRTRSRVSHE